MPAISSSPLFRAVRTRFGSFDRVRPVRLRRLDAPALSGSNRSGRWGPYLQASPPTGPAPPRRSVCAPGTIALSLYCRPPPGTTQETYHAADIPLVPMVREEDPQCEPPWHLSAAAGGAR